MSRIKRLRNCLVFLTSCSVIALLLTLKPQPVLAVPVDSELSPPFHEEQVHDVERMDTDWAHSGARYYIKHSDGFYMCTVGFPATDNNGRHLFITAGHCGEPGDAIYRAVYNDNDDDPMENLYGSKHYETQLTQVGSFIAKLTPNRSGQTIDIAMAIVNEGKSIPGGVSSWPTRLTSPTVGMQICKEGISSGHTCGVITQLDRLIHPTNYKQTLLGEQTTMCVISGDSGGPVISAGGAVGIVSAGAEADNCRKQTNNISFIADLGRAIKILKTKFPTLRLV